jgi:hypothetical protein
MKKLAGGVLRKQFIDFVFSCKGIKRKSEKKRIVHLG